ncbi:MAG: hypothetical protein GXC72_00875 [Chitinophagaceae bacterium]|nr:hypothetical protein [Chitinophagaceae bacterium]
MINTTLKIPFTFYSDLAKQHRFRPQHRGMEPFGLPCPQDALLPFQIKTEITDHFGGANAWKLFDIDGYAVLDLTAQIATLIETKTTTDGNVYFTYKGNPLGDITLPAGFYYVVFTADMAISPGSPLLTNWYSEVLEIKEVTDMVKLEWWNESDIDPLLYQTGYKNRIYLDTYTEAMPPNLIQEGENNGEGEFVPSFHRVVYKHKFEAFIPDYLQDAMAMLPIHDHVRITENGDSALIYQLKVTPDYGENYIGTCRLEFELSNKYMKTSCPKNISLAS